MKVTLHKNLCFRLKASYSRSNLFEGQMGVMHFSIRSTYFKLLCDMCAMRVVPLRQESFIVYLMLLTSSIQMYSEALSCCFQQ